MDLHKEIKDAYRGIRVPEAVTERLKTELYQKDFRDLEDFENFENFEIFQVEEAPRIPVLKYCGVIAASVAVCVGIGFSTCNLLSERSSDRLNPAQSVNVTMIGTESGISERSRQVSDPGVEFDGADDMNDMLDELTEETTEVSVQSETELRSAWEADREREDRPVARRYGSE